MSKFKVVVADVLAVGGSTSVVYGITRLWSTYTGMIVVGLAAIICAVFMVRE